MKANVTALLLLGMLCQASGQFSATMNNMVQGKSRIYKVYSDLNNYRYEFTEGGEKGIVIVKPEEQKTYVLMPSKKYVHITDCDGSMSRTNDPWQAYQWFKNFGREVDLGSKRKDGRLCKELAVYQNETRVFTTFFSEELNFPLSIANAIEEDTYMELSDIMKWNPDPSMFTVPDDYIEVDRRMQPVIPEPPPPTSWEEKNGKLPFKGTLSRGQKMWLTLEETTYYKLIAMNTSQEPAKFIYRAYNEEVPLPNEEQGKDKYRTFRLFPGQKKTLTQDWKSGYKVLIELHEGSLVLEIHKE